MAKSDFKFDDKEWRAFLGSILNKAKDMTRILSVAYGTAGIADIKRHFEDEQGPTAPWKPRKQATDERYLLIALGLYKAPKGTTKGQYNPTNKILQMTGMLKRSFLPSNWRRKSATAIEVFSNDTKSGAHDRGNKEKNIPARPFMWISGKGKDVMAQIILDKLISA